MDVNTLNTTTQKVLVQRNVFLLFSLISSISVILLTVLLFAKRERVVIVPTAGQEFWIEGNRVSKTYLEKMGVFLSDLLFTRTPANVDQKNQLILEHVHPAFYHEIKKQLNFDKNNILQFDQAFLFRTERSFADPLKHAFILEGDLIVFVGKAGEKPAFAQQERKRFLLEFDCQQGKLLLRSLKREEIK